MLPLQGIVRQADLALSALLTNDPPSCDARCPLPT